MIFHRIAPLGFLILIAAAWVQMMFGAPTEKLWRFEPDPYIAAENGDVKSVKIHLEKNPKLLNKMDSRGYTLLHYAAYGNHPELIKHLAKKGAKLEIHGNPMKEGSGERPLHMAAKSRQGGFEAAKLLIDLGADPKATVATGYENLNAPDEELQRYYDNSRGPTALDFAAWRGDSKLVELLLKKGVSPFTPPKRYGLYVSTSLHWACRPNLASKFVGNSEYSGNRKVIKLLVPAVKDVNIKALGNAHTPLHEAAKDCQSDVVNFLLKTYAKVDINLRDGNGNSALHLAIHTRHLKRSSKRRVATIKVLLKYKPDLTIRNLRDQTPRDLAHATGNKAIIALFP